MSEISKRYEQLISPDSLRKTTQLMKNHFDSYTKKNYSYQDINGLHYNGTVENFGSEILIESRKMKLDKPPLVNIKFNKHISFYFDIKYSNQINTYNQQNMLVCELKKDVLIDSREYQLVFKNVSNEIILRAESSSDPNVKKESYYVTKKNPVIIEKYTDSEGTVKTNEIELSLNEDNVNYYIQSNKFNMNHIILNDDVITINICNDNSGLPYIWIVCDKLKYLPECIFDNNIGKHQNPLLTIGTDGHDISRIYPYVYNENTPNLVPPENHKWILKIHPHDNFSFSTSLNSPNNYMIPIKSFEYICAENITSNPILSVTVNISGEYVKCTLSKDVTWMIRKPLENEYDYDGTSYANPGYAYVDLDVFKNNCIDDSIMKSCAVITFSTNYLYNTESILINAISGIHLNTTSDVSDNGVVEYNGTTHSLGEFDGLPLYLSTQLDRTIHRSHIEIYSIRDDINKINQHPMDKQTSALIIDSSIPKNELNYDNETPSNIIYDYILGNLYYTNGEVLSEKNVVSDIVYINDNLFGNRTIPGQYKYPRFIYHGNNVFSLGSVELDSRIEYGRIYVISNDPAEYENNDRTLFKKEKRTLARICDIPTSYLQLTNIPNYSPSVVSDWNTLSNLHYNRTYANYTNGDLKRLINNEDNTLIRYKNTQIFSNDFNTDDVLSMYGDNYKEYIKLNSKIHLVPGSTCKLVTTNTGSGYKKNDTFKFNIGGRYFSGIINEVVNGIPTKVSFILPENNDLGYVNISNLSNNISTYYTSSTIGVGSGFIVQLEIPDKIWNELIPTWNGKYIESTHLFKFDEYNHVWIYTYDIENNTMIKNTQITGIEVFPNEYDDRDTQNKRNTVSTMLFNLFNHNNVINYDSYVKSTSYDTKIESNKLSFDDLSNDIINTYKDYQNSLYFLNSTNTRYLTLDRYSMYSSEDTYTLPRYHRLNLHNFNNTSNQLCLSYNSTQPSLSVFNPKKDNVYEYNNIMKDSVEIYKKHEQTYLDICPDMLIEDNGLYTLKENVYSYNEYNHPIEYDELYTKISSLSRNELISFIREEFGNNALPLQYESTDFVYTSKMLIDYILQNHIKFMSCVYKKNDISLLRQKYDLVVQKTSKGNIPVGKQPSGGFDIISSEIHNPNVYIDKNPFTSSKIYFFKIDENPLLVDLSNFRLYDEDNNDISEVSILIYKKKKYTFDVEKSTWIELI